MDLANFRRILRVHIIAIYDAHSRIDLSSICDQMGLPPLGREGNRREALTESFDAATDSDLPAIADRFIRICGPGPRVRNEIQDSIWNNSVWPEIPKRVRHEIARALDIEQLYIDQGRFDKLVDDLWILDDDVFAIFVNPNRGLRAAIQRHVHRNPGDWSTEELFDKLGAFDSSDRRFALFIEGLASSDVLPDLAAQQQFAECVNACLRTCGTELSETGTDGGYPVFSIVWTHAGLNRRPKNLIFASSIKPDIRFRDAINNDIEIVTNEDKVLVYDRAIGPEGLLWRDLQSWWCETQEIVNDRAAMKLLGRRLRSSLPEKSPPQVLLFNAFYRGYDSSIHDLPALLPEVWLHWDPKTVRQRGTEALLRFRMDFLLLLPQGVRVVVEVDGKHHYAREDGLADCDRYARLASADRELKLAGYHVFRFGAKELEGGAAPGLVKTFFDSLFERFGVSIPQ